MKKLAIFPGSFSPFHKGHLNILEKAEAIFGKENTLICVGINPKKLMQEQKLMQELVSNPSLKHLLESRKNNKIKDIKLQLPSKNIDGYIGFLTDYIFEKEKQGFDVTVIRGLRNGYDL